MENTTTEGGVGMLFGEECHAGYERTDNQDRVIHSKTPYGALFAISDGVGGNQDGALAAATVTSVLLETIQTETHRSAKQALISAVEAANSRVYTNSTPSKEEVTTQRRMSATLVAALIDIVRESPVAIITNVGDSRAYLLRDGLMSQISTDHTAVQRMVAAGVLTPEQAEKHPQSSVLTQSMGRDAEVRPTVERVLLAPNDELLLCSDGLHGYVSESAILAEMLRAGVSPQAKASALLHLALEAGGYDNISVQVIVPRFSYADIHSHKSLSAQEQGARHVTQTASHEPALPSSSEQNLAVPDQKASRYVLVVGMLLVLLLVSLIGLYLWQQSQPVRP